jgi:sodium-dependent phosphate cotransporter
VIILFPLQYFTNFLGWLSDGAARVLTGGIEANFTSPIKILVVPAIDGILWLTEVLIPHKTIQITMLLVLVGILLFFSLANLTKVLRRIVLQGSSRFFERAGFQNPLLAFTLGLAITTLVQSSSITTSVVVPLAGAGILTLRQIYPYTLGANIGTTITAILASLAAPAHFVPAMTVALSHLLFNICGIVGITIFKPVRELPLLFANTLADQASKRKSVTIMYILAVFFVIPLILIYLTR